MTDKETIKQAIKEARYEERRERSRYRATKELHSTTIGLFGALALLVGFLREHTPMYLALGLGGMGLISAAFTIWAFTRNGKSLRGAILTTLLPVALCFALVYGVMWYFTMYLPNSGQPLFNFNFGS